MTDHDDSGTNQTPTPPKAGAPRRIAFMNQKGGVGKTTTTVNLAAAHAELGITTLVVDLDPQAHASLHLGVDPGERMDDSSVYDVLLDPGTHEHAPIHDAIVPVTEHLFCMPAETDLAAAEFELGSETDRYTRLRTALDSLGDRFGAVFFDCPPSLGLLTLNGLTAATEVIIPMQAHYLALQGVGKLLETIGLLTRGERAINPSLKVSGVVVCMHDHQAAHTREVVEDLETFFSEAKEMPGLPWSDARVFEPAVRRNIKLAECPSFGQTIFQYAPDANGAKDYAALADAVFGTKAEWASDTAQALHDTTDKDVAKEQSPEVHVVKDSTEAHAESA